MSRPIAIYGGAFDPIHNGHVIIVECLYLLGYSVWMIPSFNHPFGKKMASFKDRCEMCIGATLHVPGVNVLPYEKSNETGATIHLVDRIQEDFPDEKFSFVVGELDALEIGDWHRGDELIKRIPFIVIPRPPTAAPRTAWYKHAPHRYLESVSPPEASSTAVRQALSEGRISPHLPEFVAEVIARKGLYQNQLPAMIQT